MSCFTLKASIKDETKAKLKLSGWRGEGVIKKERCNESEFLGNENT